MINNISMSVSRHKVGRAGEQLVYEALEGAKWANGGFETGKQYDIEWSGIKIDVNASSIRKNTGFVFSNSHGYKKDLVNVFVGMDNDEIFFWVKVNLDNKGFYGRISEAINKEELPNKIKESIK
jgi:hypothetical protein